MAGPVEAPGGVHLVLDSSEWWKLSQDLKKFNPKLLTALRRRLRNAGKVAVAEIQHTLGLPSPARGADTGEFRAMLAAATKVSLSFSSRRAGVTIRTRNTSLPEDHKAVMRVYNKKMFRHPVFGDRDVWVSQRGRPYFGQAFMDAVMERARREINDALAEAVAAVERHP